MVLLICTHTHTHTHTHTQIKNNVIQNVDFMDCMTLFFSPTHIHMPHKKATHSDKTPSEQATDCVTLLD